MELLVFGILLSATFSAVQGVPTTCCVETIKHFPLEILMTVNEYEVQTSQGVCAIDALVLHTKDKRYCATPKLQRFLQILLKLKIRHGLNNPASAV